MSIQMMPLHMYVLGRIMLFLSRN